MLEKNYKSDFELRLTDSAGAAIQFTQQNWVAKFKTDGGGIASYTASYIDGVFTNAYARDGEIFIVFDNHGLGVGRLLVDFAVDIPNANFPDGYQRVVQPYPTDVQLVKYATETPRTLDLALMLPYIYHTAYDDAVAAGYTGSYEQYTQIIGALPTLAQTATDAAARVDAIADAESKRVDAETARTIAEGDRREHEAEREQSEQAREQSEEARAAAEQERAVYYTAAEAAEQQRVESEEVRAEAETSRAESEEVRGKSESARAEAESARAEAESARAEAEATRAESEDARDKSETARAAAEATRTENEEQRAESEVEREQAEAARIAAEKVRAESEKAREANTTEAIADMQALVDDTKAATANANAAAKNATDTMADIDADVQAKITAVEANNSAMQTQLDTLVSGNASSAIESFNEITAFLADIEDTETLNGIVAGIESGVAAAQKTADTAATDITAEAARAKEAEGKNAENITSNAEEINKVSNSLTTEIERAKGAEKAVSDDLAAEVTRATTAEGKNATAISDNADAIKVNADAIALLQKSVDSNKANIDTMLQDLGYYGDIAAEELLLEADESGYAVNTDGSKVAMSGYAISKPIALTQGNIYLIKADAVDKSVSMFARRTIESRTDHVSYTYTYNSEGQPLTATADYDSSVVYTFNYNEVTDEDGNISYSLASITLDGKTVDELPSSRTYDVEVFNPLFKTGAIATPKSGYYVYFCPVAMSIIVSAKATDLAQSSTDAARGKMYGVRYGVFASIASNYVNRWERDELDARITALEAKHEKDDYNQSDYCVGAWVDGDLSPDSIKTYGDEKALLDAYEMVLIDCTDNAGTETTPVATLKRDNLFRKKDSTFAPAVCISADDAADAELELYRRVDGEYTLYCEAGSYDAESYLDDVLRPVVQATPNNLTAAKLYKLVDDEYVEAHAMLPWETTETKYSHGLANRVPLYLLDSVVGKSGYQWKGVFTYPAVWDGIDTAAYKLAPTAFFLSPYTTISGAARSFFFLKQGESSCRTSAGYVANTLFPQTRTYPRTNDVSQITNMQHARKNNADTTSPVPFAEGGFHAHNTLVSALEIANHTKYLHKNTRFGSGISSNDTCNSEATYLLNGGFRSRVQGTEAWSYNKWNENTQIYYNASGSRTTADETCTKAWAKEQCEESQIARSWATEFGIAENQHYEMYGGEYWYVDNAEAESGYMNSRVYKRITDTFNAYNSAKEATVFDVEVVLRMSLYMGVNLNGDIWGYCGGGFEHIGTCTKTGSGGQTGYPIDVYLQPDQSKWVYDTTVNKDNLGRFDCEDSFIYLGSYKTTASGQVKQRMSYAVDKTANGGTMGTGECAYYWAANYWGYSALNRRTRVESVFRTSCGSAVCSPRACFAYYAVSNVNRTAGGFAQVRVKQQ